MWNISNSKALEICENVCPYCGEHLIMNKRSFANHVRWCKKNPKYEEIKQSTIEKIKGTNTKKKYYTRICEVCGKEYTIYVTPHNFEKGEYPKTCSDECAKKLTALHTNKEDKNSKISKSLLQKKYPNRNRETKFYTKICPCCGKEFKTAKENQVFCSVKCSNKQRHKNFALNSDKRKVYKQQCSFTFGLSNYPDEFKFSLIEENGWYKAKNHGDNLYGVSRDHMFSVDEGFRLKIDPYLISHPANCELLKHSDNSSKGKKCSITIEELRNRIKLWEAKYGKYENKINYTKIEDFKK